MNSPCLVGSALAVGDGGREWGWGAGAGQLDGQAPAPGGKRPGPEASAPAGMSDPLFSKTVTPKPNLQDKAPLVLRPGPSSEPRGPALGLVLNSNRLDSLGGEGTDPCGQQCLNVFSRSGANPTEPPGMGRASCSPPGPNSAHWMQREGKKEAGPKLKKYPLSLSLCQQRSVQS